MNTVVTRQNTAQAIYSVSQLNQEARTLLEEAFPMVWIEGEISNFTRPASGHWYFTLKDAKAQVRCAMFALRNRWVNFKPDNGLQVLARARISLYEGRGDFQLLIEQLEQAGDGVLQRAFEALKLRLASEGLFDTHIKPTVPNFPHCIGIITSPTGAAIRDVLSVLKRRFPAIPIIIYPTAVQGKEAAAQICAAIAKANQQALCNVILLVRGGGSLEDLWSFNEETVARAICKSLIPIVAGIGHEIDVTIADFAASQRAPTPSAAAEMVSPDCNEWQQYFEKIKQRCRWQMQALLTQQRQNLTWLQKRLKHPGQRLQEQAQSLDQIELNLKNIIKHQQQQRRLHLQDLINQFHQHHPQARVTLLLQHLQNLNKRLSITIHAGLYKNQQHFHYLSHALETINPLATLNRGYAIASKDDMILRQAQQVSIGEKIALRLHQGNLTCLVTEVNEA